MRVSDGDGRRRAWLEALADERYRHAVAAAMRPPTQGVTHISAPLVQTMLRLAARVAPRGAVQPENDEKSTAGATTSPPCRMQDPLQQGTPPDDDYRR